MTPLAITRQALASIMDETATGGGLPDASEIYRLASKALALTGAPLASREDHVMGRTTTDDRGCW